MNAVELRLECLKLAHGNIYDPSKEVGDVLDRAEIMLQWLLEPLDDREEKLQGKPTHEEHERLAKKMLKMDHELMLKLDHEL